MKKLTGFYVINDTVGKKIAYTYSEINEEGTIINSNIRESFVVIDEEIGNSISIIEKKIEEKLA